MNPNRLLKKLAVSAVLSLSLLLIPSMVSAQLNVVMSGNDPTCYGWTNGEVSALIQNGTGPFNIVWSNGATNTEVLQSVGAGDYGVTVTDANNETVSSSITLFDPAELVAAPQSTSGCAGTGDASANASGGTGTLTYLWDNGATTADVSGLSAGFHCVTVTDFVGCQAVGCVNIAGPLEIEMVVSGLACFNFCDASVEAIVTGGTAPYTYSWSNGANGSVNENLGPGDYSVTVTDQAGCTILGTATVDNPFPIDFVVDVTNPACGSGGTGSATVTASGGTAPYIYTWSNGASGPTVTNLAPGTYTVTATDFLGCQGIVDVVIIPDDDISLNVTANPSSGCGVADGSASAAVVGGTAPFDIVWSNGATGDNVSGLAPGDYTVMVTDANGCGATASVTIDGTPAIDLNITGVNGGCAANGSASAMVTPGSGTPPFDYLWNTGATTSIINDLVPGTYSVTVTDAAGCTATDQVTVSGSADISVSTTVTDVSCFAGSDGSASATVTGATGQVFYMWNNGGMEQTITGLPTGTYFVTVVDNASGCTATTNAFVGQPTEVVATATGVDGGCDDLGSATADASGGTAPYTFEWNNGATTQTITDLMGGTYTVTATDANGCTDEASVTVSGGNGLNVEVEITNPTSGSGTDDGELTANVSGGTMPYFYLWSNNENTQTIGGLAGGTYSVTVTDVEGCTGTDQVVLEQLGCIGDRVWNDVNKDGCQDPGEIGIGGVVVTLTGTDDLGNAINMTTETALNGSYLFEDLYAGSYTVTFSAPANYVFSPSNACSDDFTDSDPDASGSVSVDLDMGHCNVTVDAGVYDECVNLSTPGEICCDQTLCGPGNDPDPINSVVDASGGGSPTVYMWMFTTTGGAFNPNTWYNVPNSNSASYDPGPLQQTTYFIRCAKAADCDDWLESNVVTITVDDDAVAAITGENAVCVGDEVLYEAYDNGPDASYSWDFGPWATPSTSTDQNVLVTWNQAGVVYVTLTVENNGCTSTTEMGVSISDSPVFCGSALIVNATDVGNAVMLDWDAEQLGGNYSFVIQRSANGVDFENLATMPEALEEGMHNYTFADYFPKKGNSFYRLELMDDDEHMLYSEQAHVQRFNHTKNFITYPNPASDVFFVEANDQVQTAVQAEILSLSGKVVSTEQIAEGIVQHSVLLDGLRAGTYFLRLTYNDGQQEIVRLVKN